MEKKMASGGGDGDYSPFSALTYRDNCYASLRMAKAE